jgi:hypothetical protein
MAPSYSGVAAYPFPGAGAPMASPGHHHHGGGMRGFCSACCHPRSQCCCGRQCRKEPKELLVLSAEELRNTKYPAIVARAMALKPLSEISAEDERGREAGLSASYSSVTPLAGVGNLKGGAGKAFIGGGCCVHLSVEYAPSTPTASPFVRIIVDDSEGTILAWGKQDPPGMGYQVKEGIITTKPGADLTVLATNATVRVRWCEIFSC